MSEASAETNSVKHNTRIVSTSIENLVKTFVFGPDCTVDNVLPEADSTLQAQVPLHQFRLTAINDKTVVDSGELKSTLLEHAANGETNITVTFAPTTMKEDKVQIEDSVMCNGAPSTVRAESKEAIIEMLKEIQDTPSSNSSVSSSNASTPNHASCTAKETRNGVMHPDQLLRNKNNVSAHWQEEKKLTSPRSHRRKVSDTENVIDEMRSVSCETIGSGNSSDSEVSVEFNSVQFSPINRRPINHALHDNDDGAAATGQMQLAMSPRLPGSNESPTLLEFDKMGLSLRAEDATKLGAAYSPTANTNRRESSVRSRLARALEKVKPLNCVICITQDFNPIAEIELLAMSMHKQLIAIDLGVKLRLRPRFEVFATEFKEAMRLGAWFVLVNAHKSMSSCQHLEELVHELREEIESTNATSSSSPPEASSVSVSENAINNSSISRESKIIISLEPHPHFPRGLVDGAVVIKLTSSFDNSAILSESMATSSMRTRLVTADTLSASQLGTLIRQPITTTTFGKDNKGQHKKRVRISAAVDIVDIPPREALRMNAIATSNADRASNASTPSASSTSSSSSYLFSQNGNGNYYHHVNNKGSNNNNNNNMRSGRSGSNGSCSPIDVSGTVALMKSFMGVPGDKFLCVQRAGEIGRFAVGSSLGNLYFLDSLGNSLLQAHAHNASIWDVTFADKYHFATGCEDGTAASWQLASAAEKELPVENNERTTLSCSNASTNTNTNCPECKGNKPCNTHSSSSSSSAVSNTSSSLMVDEVDAGIVPTAATSLGDDVYCVSYVNGAAHAAELPPLVIGGLHSAVVIRSAHSTSVSLVPISSNAQVADSFPSYSVSLVGGGDGSITVIDVATASVMATLQEHSRKVPALTVCNDHVFFSGAFDSSILSWDVRLPHGVTGNVAVPQSITSSSSSSSSSSSTTTTVEGTGTSFSAHTLHTLKLKNYVTGLSVDHNHLAATVGENLYLWDVRNLNTVLGGYPQGWKGLTRGIKVQSTDHIVVTGSQDGQVRFWTFV